MSRERRCRGDRGIGPSIEVMALLLILFLPIVLMTGLSVVWFQRYTAAQDLAEDITRIIVTAPDGARPPEGEFDLPVNQRVNRVDNDFFADLVADYNLDVGDVTWSHNLADFQTGYLRGRELTVTVTVTAPGLTIPFVGAFGSRDLTATHTERIDQHRSITRP